MFPISFSIPVPNYSSDDNFCVFYNIILISFTEETLEQKQFGTGPQMRNDTDLSNLMFHWICWFQDLTESTFNLTYQTVN